MQKLYLLDAYALIYRAYYALIRAPRVNSKGQNTSAIYGFVNTLEELLRRDMPDYIAIAFDPAGPTFRHEAYPGYKAQRESTPEDIRSAVPVIKEIVRAYRIPLLEVPGYEADDVIGTVARMAASEGLEVRMVTPDKDYAQLVEPHILMQRPGRAGTPWEVLGVEEVCAKYGFSEPGQMIDYLALMGDASDNIPGCPGVGPKTAASLISQFGSVENMLANTDQLRGAQRQRVEQNAENITFSKYLVRINTEVPMPSGFTIEGLRRVESDTEALRTIFQDLEFRTLLQRLKGGTSDSVKTAPTVVSEPSLFDVFPSIDTEILPETTENNVCVEEKRFHLIENEDELLKICAKILTFEKVGLEIVTTTSGANFPKLLGFALAAGTEGEAWYVSLAGSEAEKKKRLLESFRPLLTDEKLIKVGHDLKNVVLMFSLLGIELAVPMFDTMLAHYVLQPELRHELDDLAEIFLRCRSVQLNDLVGQGSGKYDLATLDPKILCSYACSRAEVALQLHAPLALELGKLPMLEKVFHEIEMPLMPVLARMERAGVCIDTGALRETERLFTQRLTVIEEEIYSHAGHSFNISSPRQVGEVLFGEMQLSEKVRKTKNGQFSTSEEVLQGLRTKHPIVQKILEHRGLKKLLNTYIEALPRLINPETGCIHTHFNQAVTATGRLSSSNPNLQNIPVRGEDGREIRKAFVPEEGCVFFSADYSQIELRIMAHLSGDPHMIAAFRDGLDVHAATAARIFKKDITTVTRDERRKAKTANFGIIYGISAFGLAERMEVPKAEAKVLIDNYFATYPKVREFIENNIAAAREQGYIETVFGRRRYLPDIASGNSVVRGYAERNAVNAPIQGTAADIIKVAMIRIDERLRYEGLQAKMILQVHDELNFSVPQEELSMVRQLVIEEMEAAYRMSVPLQADCGVGTNWLEAH